MPILLYISTYSSNCAVWFYEHSILQCAVLFICQDMVIIEKNDSVRGHMVL